MERRYTALAEEQGQLAADKEKLSSEKQALMEVATHMLSQEPTMCLKAYIRSPAPANL